MSDVVRSGAVLGAAVLQIAGGFVGGAGLWGESVGVVANSYPTLLLPGGTAFSIWSVIYLTFLALAVRQVLPAQRVRDVHRWTGWLLVAAGVLNAGWIVLFSHRYIVLAQLVILALLVVLAVAALRLRGTAEGWVDRLLLHLPVTLYLGWVAIATLAGAATTLAAVDQPPSAALAVGALVVAGVLAVVAVLRLPATVGFAASTTWALAWIAAGTESSGVMLASLAAALVVVLAVLVRATKAAQRDAALWG